MGQGLREQHGTWDIKHLDLRKIALKVVNTDLSVVQILTLSHGESGDTGNEKNPRSVSKASPVCLMWSLCSIQDLYGVPCKASLTFPGSSLHITSWNLWLAVHYQEDSSSEVGAASIGCKYHAISCSSAVL